MGHCLDKLTEKQKQEITHLLVPTLVKRITVLENGYDLCPTCTLHLLTTTILAVVKLAHKDMTADAAVTAVLASLEHIFDEIAFVEENDTELANAHKRKMH